MSAESALVSLGQLIARQVERNPQAEAILAQGRRPLSYAGLSHHVEAIWAALNARCTGRNDRVATVLPEVPEAVVAHIAIAASATRAPLNPAYPAAEFDFHLTDLNVQALLVPASSDSPAVDVARSRGSHRRRADATLPHPILLVDVRNWRRAANVCREIVRRGFTPASWERYDWRVPRGG